MINNVTLSPCTSNAAFEDMKLGCINIIKELSNSDVFVTITTEKEDDGFIVCSTSVEAEDSGYGNHYGDVRFVNPESIVNFIMHCAGHTDIGSIGIGFTDLSDTEVELILAK